ncbi:MAG: hypothetical protein CMK70_07445 [Pseudohongiella sp.]|nr:hypothetical protein [Pseudohongiella sp.]|tara:strand:- start:16670 stop:18007 length:1338 start_codon:yes stop_codon:yes gene_type:complete
MRLSDDGQIWLRLQSGNWLIRNGQVTAIDDEFSTSQPTLLFSDFGGAPHGVEKVKGSRRYAAAILEKNLRDRGETEGISQVLLLDARSDAGITQALYQAISAEDYLAYKSLVRSSSDHLVVGSHLSLLLARAQAEKVSNVCVLLQHENCLDVLVRLNNKTEFSRRFTVSESTTDEWLRAAQFVAEEILEVAGRSSAELQYAVWADWNPSGPDVSATICEWLERNTSLQINKDPVSTFHLGDFILQSALPVWIKRFHSKDSIFPVPSLIWYWSERVLPAAIVALVAAGFSLAAAAYQWQQQIDRVEQSSQATRSTDDAAQLVTARESVQQSLPPLPSIETQELVQTLTDAHAQMSLASVIADIQSAMTPDTRLSSIRLDNTQAEHRLVLDGWIDGTPASVNEGVEELIDQLTAAGYIVRDNGLSAYRQKNYFQLVLLISREVSHEV